ncbi:MAG: bifunctional hydroxymethylpyrimidine kinase/phosphomethylpyrimidine kinase [Rikenellaceae bacterium]
MEDKIDLRCPVALSIAGSDSSAGAGIQADIKSCAALGGYMATVITALTAQNGTGVEMIDIVSKEMVAAQIHAVMSDMRVEALKTGMIPNKECVNEVVKAITKYNIKNVVVDPVMVSTSGTRLIDKEAITTIIEQLFPKALIVTPNIIECSYITGYKAEEARFFDSAAARFSEFGCKYLLLKGGHLESDHIVDVLYDFENGKTSSYEYTRVNTPNTHGTGCSLSSAIAAALSKGHTPQQSVALAEDYIHKAIEEAKGLVYGQGHGPISHFFQLSSKV